MAATLRRLFALTVVAVGVVSSVATTGGSPADISGSAGPFDLMLDAQSPSAVITAAALLDATDPIAAGSGEITLSVSLDDTADGSLHFLLRSETSGESNDGDIFDPEGQGSSSVAVIAFEGCGSGSCTEELTIEFERTDDALEGSMPLSWSLDGIASLDTPEDAAGSGTLDFDVDN